MSTEFTTTTITALRPATGASTLVGTVLSMLRLVPEVALRLHTEVRPCGIVVHLGTEGPGAREMITEGDEEVIGQSQIAAARRGQSSAFATEQSSVRRTDRGAGCG